MAQGRHEKRIGGVNDRSLFKILSENLLGQDGNRSVAAPFRVSSPPPTKSVRELRRNFGKWDFPLLAKPRCGAGSREQTTVYERSQLESIPDSWIVQPYLSGPEYTLNAYVDASGHCRCLIPHRRLEVVDGEVNRAITVKDARLILGSSTFSVVHCGGDV